MGFRNRKAGNGIKGNKGSKLNRQVRKGKKISWGYLFPSLAGVLLFFVLPFLVVIYYSLVDNPINREFVFLDNFVRVATNKAFQQAAFNTLKFSVVAVPLAVILSVPFGLAGAFLFTQIFGHSNDIYMQISLIMLIGLLAKNAILIVQFALERRDTGMDITYSSILGAGARLRPILMTSLAMVIGLLPMMFAMGVGANGNRTLGAAAVGGMLIGTILQIFVVPALFVIFEKMQEKITPKHFVGLIKGRNDSELNQYTRPTDK